MADALVKSMFSCEYNERINHNMSLTIAQTRWSDLSSCSDKIMSLVVYSDSQQHYENLKVNLK